MSKDPAFLFYSADFLVGVSDLTMTERGQYITLLCLQHTKGHLSRKSIEIALGSVSEDVLAKFSIDENGCYYNERLETETLKRRKFVESRLNNLTKSACTSSHMESHMGNHTESRMENENINDNDNNNDIDNNLYFQMFNEFWNIYPKKVNKERARRAFVRIKPNAQLFEQIMCALEIHKRCAQWQDTQYIPYPATWLNGKRWEDEIPDEKNEYTQIAELYNSICEDFPKVEYLTDERKLILHQLLKKYKVEDFEKCFTKATNSTFLCSNPNGWKPTFDWLITENNMIKVLEGNFDDGGSFNTREAFKLASERGTRAENSFDTDDFFQAALKRSYGK